MFCEELKQVSDAPKEMLVLVNVLVNAKYVLQNQQAVNQFIDVRCGPQWNRSNVPHGTQSEK